MLELDIGLLTPELINSKTQAKCFFELLLNSLPEFAPERFGNYEPLKKKFGRLEEALDSWNDPFLWKRNRPRVEGNVWMTDSNAHGAIYIDADMSKIDPDRISNFFRELSILFKPDFGYINLFTSQENQQYPYEMTSPFRQGVNTHQLRKNLPNLCWGTVFGTPYLELFGVERIRSAPAFAVRELAPNLFYLQLSENLLDLKSDFERVDTTRRAVKTHLNQNAFLEPFVDSTRRCKVPDFYLPAVTKQVD